MIIHIVEFLSQLIDMRRTNDVERLDKASETEDKTVERVFNSLRIKTNFLAILAKCCRARKRHKYEG